MTPRDAGTRARLAEVLTLKTAFLVGKSYAYVSSDILDALVPLVDTLIAEAVSAQEAKIAKVLDAVDLQHSMDRMTGRAHEVIRALLTEAVHEC